MKILNLSEGKAKKGKKQTDEPSGLCQPESYCSCQAENLPGNKKDILFGCILSKRRLYMHCTQRFAHRSCAAIRNTKCTNVHRNAKIGRSAA
jgi:hypothetical protein